MNHTRAGVRGNFPAILCSKDPNQPCCLPLHEINGSSIFVSYYSTQLYLFPFLTEYGISSLKSKELQYTLSCSHKLGKQPCSCAPASTTCFNLDSVKSSSEQLQPVIASKALTELGKWFYFNKVLDNPSICLHTYLNLGPDSHFALGWLIPFQNTDVRQSHNKPVWVL